MPRLIRSLNVERLRFEVSLIRFAISAVKVALCILLLIVFGLFFPWLVPPSPLFYVAILVFLIVAIIRGVVRKRSDVRRKHGS